MNLPTPPTSVAPNEVAFLKNISNPLRFRFYLLKNLPSAFFSGLKIVAADKENCLVSLPYKWFTKNPFRSTYFACLSMAAELSTGVLAMAYVYRRHPAVSLLVVRVEAQFYKKATGMTLFTCSDGSNFKEAVETAIKTGHPQSITALSVGRNKSGELVAEFKITWSFKSKAL